jgi:hypothetical protein
VTATDRTSADLTGDTLDDAAAGTSDETTVDQAENLPVAVDRPVVSAGLRRHVLAASDLDRTLIYSGKAAKLGLPPGTKLRESPLYEDLVCVEMYDHKPLSHVTRTALASITRLAELGVLVPATTRTRAQYRRISLPGPPVPYAITANGGFLLVDGETDDDWTRQVERELAASSHPFAEVQQYMADTFRPEFTSKLRNAEELFCYAVVDRAALPDGFVAEVSAWAAAHGWRASLQGRKLYVVPVGLRKGAAVAEVARRVGAETVLAAGDSLLDAEMLESATRAVRPAHGELHEVGWQTEGLVVTATAGATGGQEVAQWLLDEALAVLGKS